MFRLASDTDSTYQPHAMTNQALTNQVKDMNNVYGSKNVLWHDLSSVSRLWENEYSNRGSWSGRAWTFVGVTYTFNEDGSVTLSGTSTGTPINMRLAYLEGLSDGATYVLSNKGSTEQERLMLEIDGTQAAGIYGNNTYEFVYDSTKTYRLLLKCTVTGTTHDSTVYPMLCLKSIYELDNTYQPPTKTNQQLTEDTTGLLDNLEVNGAVNMCKNDAVTTTTSDGTTTFTWTVNDDKTVTVSAPSYPVTLASAQILKLWGSISAKECNYLVGKTVKLTGCPSGGGNTNFELQAYRVGTTDGSSGTYKDYGDGVTFTWLNNGSSTKSQIVINIKSGYSMTGPLTFKPMITVPSYKGDYVPYAKSNEELTDDVAEIVRGGAYVYPLPSYFYHIAITASIGSGQYIKLVTIHGEVNLATSSSSIRMPNGQKVILNQANDASTWTYSLDGLTANLNSTGHLIGYIISNHPLTFTVVDTSTLEANTLDTLNLALLSNS